MGLYDIFVEIILYKLENNPILDFNEAVNYLNFEENYLKEIKTHKWPKFIRKDFLHFPTDIRCIVCNSHFTTIYNRVVGKYNYKDEPKTCEEWQIKNLLE